MEIFKNIFFLSQLDGATDQWFLFFYNQVKYETWRLNSIYPISFEMSKSLKYLIQNFFGSLNEKFTTHMIYFVTTGCQNDKQKFVGYQVISTYYLYNIFQIIANICKEICKCLKYLQFFNYNNSYMKYSEELKVLHVC